MQGLLAHRRATWRYGSHNFCIRKDNFLYRHAVFYWFVTLVNGLNLCHDMPEFIWPEFMPEFMPWFRLPKVTNQCLHMPPSTALAWIYAMICLNLFGLNLCLNLCHEFMPEFMSWFIIIFYIIPQIFKISQNSTIVLLINELNPVPTLYSDTQSCLPLSLRPAVPRQRKPPTDRSFQADQLN